MIPVVSQLHLDMAHHCVRQTLALVREGRNDEALEVANLAVESYDKAVDKAVSASKSIDLEIFAILAMLVPHSSERSGSNKQSAA